MDTNEEILKTAVFDKMGIIKYRWTGLFFISLLIVTIPITLPIAVIQYLVLSRVIDSWECVLTSRALHVKKGVFVKIEKTVPLEKITDLQMVQGPIMRMYGLHRISVETAGQSGPGSLISLVGIQDTEQFRMEVLEQRDAMSKSSSSGDTPQEHDASRHGGNEPVLAEIRDSLARTEDLLRTLVSRTPDN